LTVVALNACIDYRGILNPAAEPRGRASRVLANLAGRTFWHKLYDNTPSLARALGDDGSVRALLAFLADCERQSISLDWRMPLIFLAWLGMQPTKHVEDENAYVLECMTASAAAWAGEITDIGIVRMVLVCSVSKLAVGAMRPLTIDSGARIFRLQLETDLPSDSRFHYAVSAHADHWPATDWRPVHLVNP
jgi:hypothetical protein